MQRCLLRVIRRYGVCKFRLHAEYQRCRLRGERRRIRDSRSITESSPRAIRTNSISLTRRASSYSPISSESIVISPLDSIADFHVASRRTIYIPSTRSAASTVASAPIRRISSASNSVSGSASCGFGSNVTSFSSIARLIRALFLLIAAKKSPYNFRLSMKRRKSSRSNLPFCTQITTVCATSTPMNANDPLRRGPSNALLFTEWS